MKKVFSIILAVLLFVGCCAISIEASDETGTESVSVSIEAMNLEFAEYLYLWAGVRIDGVDYDGTAKNAGVIFWREEQTDGYTYDNALTAKQSNKAFISDVSCTQAIYNGVTIIVFPCPVAAKQMADVFYMQAYVVVDGEYYYSDKIVPYSVVKYAQYQLYYGPSISDDLQDCLLAMLQYGATAQKLFDYKIDNLATNVIIKYSEGLSFSSNKNGTCSVDGLGSFTETEELYIPKVSPDGDKVTSIGDSAFSSCISLTSVTIPNSVTSIGDSAFSSCISLTSVTIPNSVTSIGDRAFECCFALTNITLSNSLTSIGDYAFNSCSALTNITLSNSVTSIGEYAFAACGELIDIHFQGTQSQWNAITKGDNWDGGTGVYAASGSYTVHCTDGDITQ